LPGLALADERSDQARRAEEVRRAEEARRAKEARENGPADPALHRPERWKLADLEAREKAGAKFSAEEKAAYERLKVEREKRRKDLAEADAKKEQDREARRLEAQRQLLARYRTAATDPAIREEFQRDAQIMAQLKRARDVAQTEGRDDAVTRVDSLIQKETARHTAWLAAHGQG
jgi:hypothetical protein